jgi:hypothetical protein
MLKNAADFYFIPAGKSDGLDDPQVVEKLRVYPHGFVPDPRRVRFRRVRVRVRVDLAVPAVVPVGNLKPDSCQTPVNRSEKTRGHSSHE